jgi:indole-3-glycerol phosphate synthase
MSVLFEIAKRTAERLAAEKEKVPLRSLLETISAARKPFRVLSAFDTPGVHVIAEIKRASPSQGAILEGADPVAVAGAYLEAGATMLSVLTEPDYFHGSPEFLARIRERYPEARLLMKDFIIDEYQIAQARRLGADAILLIASLLDGNKLQRLFLFATALGLTPLVEVHDEAEMARAIALGAYFIGVNNRNLSTLEVSLDVSRKLARLAPKQATLISESGLSSGDVLKELRGLGFKGFLVGTSLMKTGTPGPALAKLIREAA